MTDGIPMAVASPTMENTLDPASLDLEAINAALSETDATRIIEWAAETFGDGLVMSTSFGIHAAVTLHLATRVVPRMPVVWVDTGYMPPETYQFAEALSARLELNLRVYQAEMSPARMEALYGRLWESDDVELFNRYDRIRKVEPMQRALRDLGASAWIAGLRSQQTAHRGTLPIVGVQWQRYKVHPVLRWTTKQMHEYLVAHDLPYHPLFEKGYATVGDWHSSRAVTAEDGNERATRFRGMKEECGLHLPETPEEDQSMESSDL